MIIPPKNIMNQSVFYSNHTIERAERALICSPFQLALFIDMRHQSISIQQIALAQGEQQGYTKKRLSEPKADQELGWLINVGLLRREVDGQGITDSFRLTPLGKKIIDKIESTGDRLPNSSWLDHVYNNSDRWLRLPF